MKIVDHAVYSSRMGTKKNHWVPNQGCTADDPSIRCFECSNSLLFEPMCESSHCHDEEQSDVSCLFSLFHRRFLANRWLCTTQNLLFYDLLEALLQYDQFF